MPKSSLIEHFIIRGDRTSRSGSFFCLPEEAHALVDYSTTNFVLSLLGMTQFKVKVGGIFTSIFTHCNVCLCVGTEFTLCCIHIPFEQRGVST